jgi:glycosyltransferase involved in cell wall biosynthesis
MQVRTNLGLEGGVRDASVLEAGRVERRGVSGGPLFPEVGIVATPYHSFASRWTTPHYVMTGLADFFQVAWLEPAGHWRQTRARGERIRQLDTLAEGLPSSFQMVHPPVWAPDVYSPQRLRDFLLRARYRQACYLLRKRGCQRGLLHLWHHKFAPLLDVAKHEYAFYHVDDEYSFQSDPPPMCAEERRVIQEVDQVFVISQGLLARKGGINPNIRLVPEGVDFRLYSTPCPVPADMAEIPRPIVGYTGVIKSQLDWELLRTLAERNPQWSFVYVGLVADKASVKATVAEMDMRPNVYFLGAKSRLEIACYPQHFDACTMPYLVNGYTNNIYPLKLHEYLAGGRPSVGTPIRSLLDYQSIITVASTVDEWEQALHRALAPVSTHPKEVAERRAVAAEYDWQKLIFQVAESICAKLGPSYLERLTAAHG